VLKAGSAIALFLFSAVYQLYSRHRKTTGNTKENITSRIPDLKARTNSKEQQVKQGGVTHLSLNQ
jgi:NADH:ubiquinone oxidoreductase subunit 4 (subunit M)